MELLAGLLDTDGYLDKNIYEIVQKSVKLAGDIVALANSLGFFCRTVDKIGYATNTEKKVKRTYKRTYIYPSYNTSDIPVIIDYKKLNTDDIGFYGIKIALEKTKASHKHIWSEEMKEQFAATAIKYTVKNRVQWTKLVAGEDMYKHISVNSLRLYHTNERKRAAKVVVLG